MDSLATPFTATAWQACFARMEQISGRPLTSRQCSDLQQYSQMLLEANRHFNLIGPSAVENLLSRHLLDALPLLPFLPPKARVADLGSGGGLPGIVLAILSQPPQRIHLIESIGKKARFLQEVVTQLALSDRVRVSAQRAEALGAAEKKTYDRVVSRALGSLRYGGELAAPLLRPGGAYLVLKGRNHADEFAEWRRAPVSRLFQEPVVHALHDEGDSVIVQLIKKVRPANAGRQSNQ
ncbi:MAG: 16S rRNA (guanine(527)-N(7))-methyltransferase RsmG [Magnetococcales bacterium]|nr:16S rRNA (guanine(527)-N(7))-methyltransferase RsmG [Magnetococcales bacterium]